jgi:hypothetical protein
MTVMESFGLHDFLPHGEAQVEPLKSGMALAVFSGLIVSM